MAHRRLHTPYDRTTGQKVFRFSAYTLVRIYHVLGSPVTLGLIVAGSVAGILLGH